MDNDSLSLKEKALSLCCSGKSPSDQPVAVLMAGQPGAGKTSLLKQLFELPNYQNMVHLSMDRLHSLHPDFHKQKSERLTRSRIHEELRPVMAYLSSQCLGRRYNVVYDMIMSDPEQSLIQIKELQELGYGVEVHALSVNYLDSLLSLCNRFIVENSRGVEAQWMPLEVHDYSYYAFPESIRSIQDNLPDISINVWARKEGGLEKIYSAPTDGANPYGILIENRLNSKSDLERVQNSIASFINRYDVGSEVRFWYDSNSNCL